MTQMRLYIDEDSGDTTLVRSLCRYGLMVYSKYDIFIGRSLALYGEWSETEIDIFRQILHPGDVVVEAGANIGSHTIFLAQAVGLEGTVFAFEPQRLIFQTLCANLVLNDLTNVITRHAALGRETGVIRVPFIDYKKSNNFGGLELGGLGDGEQVEVQTIDSLQLPKCHLIKADVEGMELEVISGALETINRLRPIIYIENDRIEKSEELISLIQGMGYRLWWHISPLYNPDNFRGSKENIFQDINCINMLCFPKEMPFKTALPEVVYPKDTPLKWLSHPNHP